MQFYEFGDALRPLGEKAPEKWENVLALLEPSELSAVTLPDTLTPPLTSDSVYGSQLCALLTDQNGITGHIRIPARGSQAARRFAFSWSQGNVLIVDHDRVVANCLDAIRAMRPHNADGADNFLADLLLTLVRDDLAALEQLEERITNLEQEVLADNTDRFIHRMSAIRTAPFYGAKNTGYILCTMDGIQIDQNMNAVDTNNDPIPGLYVVGNDSGGYFSGTYPNLSTGAACGRTVTFGRRAGRIAATQGI